MTSPSRTLRHRLRTTYQRLRYDAIYGWRGWGGMTTFNVGLAPVRPEIEADPALKTEGVHLEIYAAAADLILAAGWPDGGTALEIGCGRGGGLAYLTRRLGRRVVGVDIAGAAVRHARASGLEAVRASATALPFPDRSLDAALAVEILFRFGEGDTCLSELGRVLKPGAPVAVADFRPYPFTDARDYLTRMAERNGFSVAVLQDRTEDARRAIVLDEPRRRAVYDALPRILRRNVADTLALAGTPRYRGWVDGERGYVVALLVNGTSAAARGTVAGSMAVA